MRSGGGKEMAGSTSKIVEINSAGLCAAASRDAKSKASSISGASVAAASWPMSRRIVTSVRAAMIGSLMPSTHTLVRWPSPVRPEQGLKRIDVV